MLSGIMSNSTFRGRGLTARFLYCMPKSFIGKRKYRSNPIPTDVQRRYESIIRNMLDDEYPVQLEEITLSPEADILIEEFANELEPKLNTEYTDIKDWAGKLVGNIARISALLCRTSVYRSHDFLADIEPLVVTGDTMGNAICITKLMAQGYIDQVLYNKENNELLILADNYKAEIDSIQKSCNLDSEIITALSKLLRFTEHSEMLTNFDVM